MIVSRDLTLCAPALQRAYAELWYLWDERFIFRKLFITCTYRDSDAQKRLWDQGRLTPGQIVTFCNGTTTLSPHNRTPCEAIDVAIRLLPGDPEESVVKEAVTWKAALYWPLVKLASQVGLVSGGTFRMRDWPHLELPGSSSTRILTT